VINIVPIGRSLTLAILLATGLGVASCSGGGGGSDPTANSTTTNSASSSDNPVASIDPCTLISQDDMSKLGLTSRGREDTANSRGCGWDKGATYSFGLYANRNQGIDELRDSSATAVSLSSHDAIQMANGIDCLVDIAITKTSSINVSIEASGTSACGIATQYATLIEPKLPAQQK
jgi:hypothetical protein